MPMVAYELAFFFYFIDLYFVCEINSHILINIVKWVAIYTRET